MFNAYIYGNAFINTILPLMKSLKYEVRGCIKLNVVIVDLP